MPPPPRPITPTQVSRDQQRQLCALRPFLIRFALKRTQGNLDLAEDIVQDVFFRFLHGMGNYEEQSPNGFRNYLCSCIIRRHIDVRRKASNRFEVVDTDHTAFGLASATCDQHTRLELIDTLNALDLLQPEQATCILGAALGEEQLDASIRTGIPHGTVKSRVSRGRAALRKLAGHPHSS